MAPIAFVWDECRREIDKDFAAIQNEPHVANGTAIRN